MLTDEAVRRDGMLLAAWKHEHAGHRVWVYGPDLRTARLERGYLHAAGARPARDAGVMVACWTCADTLPVRAAGIVWALDNS